MEPSIVYVKTDEVGRITAIDGGYTTPQDLTGWTQIDEGFGDTYNLCQTHYFEGGIYTGDGIPRYKLAEGKAVERTEEEIQADREVLPKPEPTPTVEELQAKITALTTSNQMLEDCIIEMAGVIYA